jgi:hypothetical protein
MHKRFLAISGLTASLLFTQGGYFLVAAFCPHLRSGMASCETVRAEPPMSHEDMGHMGHMEMQHEPASQPNPDALALGQPTGPCSHCAVHSRRIPTTVSLRETEGVKRSGDLNIPLNSSRVAPVSVSPVAVLTSRAHGPPGEAIPRHVLINIFRI